MASDEVILIDKPKGITSFDVIRILRKKLGVRKMGHAGTLDPLASGLMIIGIGKATKKLREYLKLPKTYKVQILLGKKTTTGDLEGKVIEEKEVSEIDEEKLEKVLKKLTGQITLAVPAYSAVKVKGQPLYKRARKGEAIKPPEKQMEILSIKLKGHFPQGKYYILEIDIEVSSGTYIRSIAEELGRLLGYPATLADLRRTKIGEYSLENAQKLDTAAKN